MTNHRNEIIKYETMVVQTEYAFTYSPSDTQQFWGEIDRYQLFKTKMCTFFMSILGTSTLRIRIEVSPNGRLHLHGFIKIHNKMEFYLHTIPKISKYGTLCIKEPESPEGWTTYCEKQHIDEWIYLPIVTKPLKGNRAKPKVRTDSQETETSP